MNMSDRPLAAAPYTSYRAKGRYGWIMIGAMNYAEAKREAARSSDDWHSLEIWNGEKYVSALEFDL